MNKQELIKKIQDADIQVNDNSYNNGSGRAKFD